MSYTIQDFWIPRFSRVSKPNVQPALAGWTVEPKPNPSFVEADLELRQGFDDLNAPVWFIAAPGAVGKSTLAREISARTGAVYLDLAQAETVAGNYLTGGLVKNGLLDAWRANGTAVLIDALDEARLRVTLNSFDDFLSDVAELARERPFPTIVLGRVGIVEEAWLLLADKGFQCPIFDIDFFDEPRARQFILAALGRLSLKKGNEALASGLGSHRKVYEDATAAFVKGLQYVAASDGGRFSGYAPVLEAVATVLSGVTNPASLRGVVDDALQGQVLEHLTDRILHREAAKLREQLPSTIPDSTKSQLYGPEEQLERLSAIVYGVNVPIVVPGLRSQDAAAYDAAVSAFIPQHPFLDGTGRQASGAVFGALLNAHALFTKSPEMIKAAERHAGSGPYTPNPFLIDFYLDRAQQGSPVEISVPPEHVVALYESVRARATAKEIVRLSVEGDDEHDAADVEIQTSQVEGRASDRHILLRTSQAGVLRFGRQVNSVFVDAPQIDVVVGSGGPVEIIAPVSINVARLSFDTPEIVVSSSSDATGNGETAAVVLEAAALVESKISRVPVVRKGAVFSVSWPGASSYPWVQFAATAKTDEGKDVHDALLRLRKLVLALRTVGALQRKDRALSDDQRRTWCGNSREVDGGRHLVRGWRDVLSRSQRPGPGSGSNVPGSKPKAIQ
jgi:hypothetical protein